MDSGGRTRVKSTLVGPGRATSLACIAVATATLGACYADAGAALQPVTAAQIESAQRRWPDATEATLATGRDLFHAKCNACHDYPNLQAIGEGRWARILQVMGPRATLDQKQTDSVMRYVVSVHPPPQP